MPPELRLIVKARLEGSDSAVISGKVASGDYISDQFDIEGYTQVGLIIPTITSGPLTFMVAAASGLTSGTGAVDLKNCSGFAYGIPAAIGNFAVADATLREALAPWRYVRIIVVAQADGRHFKFVLKA